MIPDRPWMTPLLDVAYRVDVRRRLYANALVMADGCWEWQRKLTNDGYGQISIKHRMVRTHQVAYFLDHGPWPTALQLDHLCRNRACCNPSHLELVTPRENTRRGRVADAARARAAERTHCKHGHRFDEANTYVFPDGHRKCRRCRADDAARRWRKRAA